MLELEVVGRGYSDYGASLKSLGATVYTSDLKVPNMIYGGVLRSPYPHAEVLHIEVAKARNLPGVRAVITLRDCPGVAYNSSGTPPSPLVIKDEHILSDKARYFGDKVAAVAADTPEIVKQALNLIEVKYEVLPAVLEIDEALSPGAPVIHADCPSNVIKVIELEHGNVSQGFANADYVFEGTYSTHAVQAVPMETTSCICYWGPEDLLTVWSNTQTPFQNRRILAELFAIPEARIRLIEPCIGGAFGSRQQLHQEPVGLLLSKICRLPVKMINGREEEIYASAVRHPSVSKVKTGVNRDGSLVSFSIKMYVNTGAYVTHGPIVLAAAKSRMPYDVPNYKFEGYCVYTNATPAGALRGYGNPQFTFAREVHLDEVARRLGLDPVEFRLKNHVRAGSSIPGLPWKVESCGVEECAQAARQAVARIEHQLAQGSRVKVGQVLGGQLRSGWGVAFALHASGITDRDMGSAVVIVNDDGSVNLLTGAVDLGQGSTLALAQIVAEEIGLDGPSSVTVLAGDTASSPYDTGTFSSRQVYVSGVAVQRAARDAKRQLLGKLAEVMDMGPDLLTIKGGRIYGPGLDPQGVSLGEVLRKGSFGPKSTVIIGRSIFKPETSPPPLAVCWARVSVDVLTGKVWVPHVVIAVDVGKAINPKTVEGQVQGGVLMGVGYATTEGIFWDPNIGRPMNTGLMAYGVPTLEDAPQITVLIVESREPSGPYGAKSVGEMPTIPVAAAIANGFYNATGVRARSLPLSPANVLRWLRGKDGW